MTQTDVVRAGTRDVAKIFQILYDVDAVSGPGSYTYLGATTENNYKKANTIMYTSGVENSPSMNNSSVSTTTLHNSMTNGSSNGNLNNNGNNNGSDNFSDSAMGSTIRSLNGGLLDDYPTRSNSDAISVGSNDSADVS